MNDRVSVGYNSIKNVFLLLLQLPLLQQDEKKRMSQIKILFFIS